MFKKIINIWRKEISNDEIIKIEDEFLEHVIDYLKINSLKINDSNISMLQRDLIIKEMDLTVKILNNLYKFRRNKAFLEIIDKEEVNLNVVTILEKEFYLEILSKLRVEFINFEEQARIGAREKELTIVRFVNNIPQFLGIDLKTYGPYEADDIATIPRRNAVVLSQRDICIILE